MARDEGEQQAMTAERLAEILAANLRPKYRAAIESLLADNERLRAREAALVAEREQAMAIVERVAASADGRMLMCMCGVVGPNTRYDTPTWIMDGGPVVHQPDCVFAQARALLASAEAAAAQSDGAPHCDYCSKPWAVQAWRVNMDVREWLCAAHFDDLSSDRLYRIERDRRSEQEVLYSDEEAEAAYHSYEDDVVDEPHGEECCCEDCLQDYPERDALYNDSQFYGAPSDGTVAMLCSYPGCEAIAEIIQEGEPIPAGSIGRKHMFCPKHEQAAQGEA